MAAARILVVEDRDSLRRMLQRALQGEGHEVVTAADGEEAVLQVERRRFELVLTDLKLPGISGLEVLERSRALRPELPVVVLTAYGTVPGAVEAMKLGAADFLEKPVELDSLFELVNSILGDGEEVLEAPGGTRLVGRDLRFQAALRMLRKVAPTDSTVLLTGESGTGKELFARALHELSLRARAPFVAVNCAAIPETLVENELFGHEKGAFTGAHRREKGRFAQAEGGTLLLDEIGDLPPGAQSKVLRVLEEKTYERVGGTAVVRADVRIVAATNRDLEAMVREGGFRSDLFFRLAVFPIALPPLRQRQGDIDSLSRHLLGECASRHGSAPLSLAADALELLRRQPWPGNVRQLANVLERAVILGEGRRITAAQLRPLLEGEGESEEEKLRAALRKTEGDKRRAAVLLGWSYRTLLRRVRQLELEGYPKYRD